MTEKEKCLLESARAIKRYCKNQFCDGDCVFKLKAGLAAGLCAFEFMPPEEWHLPKPRGKKGYNGQA